MGSSSSMMYTIGTALDRAQQDGHVVDLLVEGQWLEGLVVACDGHGVVLESPDHDHAIVRLEVISAVRVRPTFPLVHRVMAPVGDSGFSGTGFDAATPMPGPRVASD